MYFFHIRGAARYCLLAAGSVVGLLAVPACTTTEQNGETNAGITPTEVRSDADRRAIYNNGGANSAVPDATPNQMRLGEQAADVNRRKRIENVNTDDPNNTTPETRLDRLNDAPATPPQP